MFRTDLFGIVHSHLIDLNIVEVLAMAYSRKKTTLIMENNNQIEIPHSTLLA